MKGNSQKIGRALGFTLWLTAATFAAATLTSWHSVALPVSLEQPKLRHSHGDRWHLTHYLSADCACSRAVARYLMVRGPLVEATEEVVLIRSSDTPAENRLVDSLTRTGFQIRITTAEAAASLDGGVQGVPVLHIEAPDGTTKFRGGYRARNTPPEEYLDVAILSGLMASKPVPELRVIGCATSRRLRLQLDPLSFRSLSFP
jgi:hypothetical protein